MLQGGSNTEVKRHNDFIIGGGNGWEFPFIQFQKKQFNSFDLKDDIADKGLSLKAIEGNLKLPIVESSVPFDIDRPLTLEELEEVIRYCKNDVDATCLLYETRKEDYLGSKIMVGEMYNLPPEEALSLTNAKLSARVLNAKRHDYNDEREYKIPERLNQNLIPKKVLDFFLQIQDKTIPSTKLFGTGKAGSKGLTLDAWIETAGGRCSVTYAWGGVHGAKYAYQTQATEDRLIVNYDVASLYPNSMINFGYCSRAMEDPNAYEKLVKRRLSYKKAGDKKRANALKLVVNTVYGAQLSAFNDLGDRLAGRSVCITNQLAMSQLLVMLGQACKSIDFLNINTDGVMYEIDKSEDQIARDIVDKWCKITGFEMERDDFSKVWQKDVNNYIAIKTDGHMKTKGGFVSLYDGGNFKTNSLSIIDKAIVEYLVNGVSPEETIGSETDIFKFQSIVKTGGTYEGSYHYINGERVLIQKVNRIYAVKNSIYGQIVKGKWITEKRHKDKTTGLMISEPVNPPQWSESTVADCPTHAYVDNENTLSVKDLDLDYYIDMAKNRIDKYINLDPKVEKKLNKIKEVIAIMPTAKTTETKSLNIYAKINEARIRFRESGIKKEGKNNYAEFKYFRLDEIIPIKQEIFRDLGISDFISFDNESAVLTLINVDSPEERVEFKSQLAPDESLIKNPIQKVGAIHTYVRRYLYLLALDIIESDAIEETTGKPEENKEDKPKKSNRPASESERQEIKKDLIDKDGEATSAQIKAIKSGLKKLREKNSNYETYVTKSVGKLKSGLTKAEAEALLIEIGYKLEEEFL